MAYSKTNWNNNTSPYITGTNLNKIEDGIYNNDQAITELDNKIGDITSNTLGYDGYDNTSTYAVGDYTIYNNTLYVCNTAVSTAEDFDSNKWTATSVKELISTAQAEPQLDNISFQIVMGGSTGQATASNPYVIATKTANLKPGKYLMMSSGIKVQFSTANWQAYMDFVEGSTSHQFFSSASAGSSDNLYGEMQGCMITNITGGQNTYSWRVTTATDGSKVVTVKAYQTLWFCAIRIGD